MVPFGRNQSFVGREETLAWLLDRIYPSTQANDCQRTIIEGLGGVGKTQIALEAAYRFRERYPDCSVFWVPVVSMTAFENAYREIGQALSLQAVEDDKADVRALVKAALSRQSAGNWLMVIDNADDGDLLIGNGDGGDASVKSALPFSPKGSILFTTRNRTVATLLDVGPKEVVAVDGMNRADAIKVLHENLEVSQVDKESTEKLIEILAYLPLAIKQASAYMRRTEISTQKYLGYCLTSDKSQTKLLCQDFEDYHRYSTIANPIATTWNITFIHISQKWPLAADSMKTICHYAEKDIPIELFPGEDEMKRDEAIGVLKGYNFILERPTSKTFDIHRLVRLAMRNWIRDKGDTLHWNTISVRRLIAIFPTPHTENKDVWLKFFPHAQSLLKLQEDCSNKELTATLIYKVAKSHHELRNYVHAERLYRAVLNLKDKELCPKRSIIWESMYYLGMTLSELGKDAEAESTLREAIKARTDVPGRTNDPDTLNAILWLAESLGDQGKYTEAEETIRKTRKRMVDVLGPKDPTTIRSWGSLAGILSSQKKYPEAEQILRQTERLQKEVLGQESPQRLCSLNNLAHVLMRQNQYEEAEQIILATIESSERVFGNEHPDTLISRQNLGRMLVRQGKYVEAERILQVTVELKEKAWGSMHPSTVKSRKYLQKALDGLAK
ncbi:kinesin light chain [Apiospora marii]|uniref:kinesin light chain n=1 Tax=Apiospora marii TaxID=335849 RepID=UPI003131D8BD